jgi:hypothetical protein
MHFGYVVAVNGDGKGGPPIYTAYLEGLGEKQVEGQRLLSPPPPCVCSSTIPLFFQSLSSQERQKGKEGISQADV